MKRKTVESSQIKAVGYDENALILEIEFKSGSVYQYDRVPASVAACMMDAGAVESVGTYFGANVKDRFPTFRVDGGERVPVEKAKASVRAFVEHPFHIVKNLFRHRKVRYRGLAKNGHQLHVLFGLANVVIGARARVTA